jgi:hypothetical protein
MKGLPEYSSWCYPSFGCSRNQKERTDTHEPIQEVITCIMALPVSFGLGAEVSTTDFA